MSSHVHPPRVNPKELYAWASRELLNECSCFLSTRAIREHKGDSCSYDHRAFARRHDDDIAVLPCTLGEPVCGDEQANDGVPFFYFYQVGVFPRVSPPTWECICARGDFLGANSCPQHLVTHFESVSTFLSYPAPGYPGRDPPHESYLPQGRLWGGMGVSRVRLLSTGAITMALKPPFFSLYCCPGSSGIKAFPRRRSLHGLSYPWV